MSPNDNKNHQKIPIMRGNNFDINFARFLGREDLFDFWYKKRFSLADSSLTYRIINHWTELGLLDDTRDDQKQWRRFSVRDFVWLHIIKELRLYGFPSEKILNVKKYPLDAKGNSKHYPIFEFYLTLALTGKPVFMIVLNDGSAEITTDQEIELNRVFEPETSYISINVNKILQKLFPAKKLDTKFNAKIPLSNSECEIIELLSSRKYKRIEIVLKNGEIDRINATESIALNDQRIIDLIKEAAYQRITVEVENGRPISVERIKKSKLPKDSGHIQANLVTAKTGAKKENLHAHHTGVPKISRKIQSNRSTN